MTDIALLACEPTHVMTANSQLRPSYLSRCAGLRNVDPDFNVGNSMLVFELDQKRLRALLDGPSPAEVGTGDMPYLTTSVEMP
jgi:hypothetical protein